MGAAVRFVSSVSSVPSSSPLDRFLVSDLEAIRFLSREDFLYKPIKGARSAELRCQLTLDQRRATAP